jgi:hypothetical protein
MLQSFAFHKFPTPKPIAVVASFLTTLAFSHLAAAQSPKAAPHEGEGSQADGASARNTVNGRKSIGLLAGVLQPIALRGGNVQFEFIWGRLVVDYSHGFALNIPAAGDAKEQGLSYYLPYSTGLGIGYRFFDSFDLRFEPKLHYFQVNYDGGVADGQRVVSYQTLTLGLGAYYSWRPFDDSSNAAKGITIIPSFRVWPTVWSSLDDNKFEYYNQNTESFEEHQAAPIGIAGTPILANVSVGYAFDL